MRYFILPLLALSLLMGGCATTHPQDPFEQVNRGIYSVNRMVDKAILKPVAETYKATVPEPVNIGVSNFFSNLHQIVVMTNNLFQLKFHEASQDAGRFLLNTTVGFFGFFDPASEYGIPKHNEDFGQTLGYWGVPSGPYIVLPLFGPSSVRDAPGMLVDWAIDPRSATYDSAIEDAVFGSGQASGWIFTAKILELVDMRADLLSAEKMLESVPDEYIFVRDAYLQRRQSLVTDGANQQDASSTISDDELFAP
jgi:phospholipid-binding lipoprotein MlaA